jgi:uncharacterized protein VirK/YbjX
VDTLQGRITHCLHQPPRWPQTRHIRHQTGGTVEQKSKQIGEMCDMPNSIRKLTIVQQLALHERARMKPMRGVSWMFSSAWQALNGLSEDLRKRGPMESLRTAARLFGVMLRYPAHQAWMKVIGGPATKKVLDVYPRIAYRHSTSYLFSGLSWAQRLELLKAHYAFLNREHDARFFNKVLDGGLDLRRWVADGHEFSISLSGPCTVSHHREGELTLAFNMSGVALFKLAFSVVPASGIALDDEQKLGCSERMIYVGQVQGMLGQFDLISQATKLCLAIAPQDLLMSALAGLAQAWGINRVLGVRADRHLSAGSLMRPPRSFDYTAFWERYHARPCASGHHVMCLPFDEKPIEQIAAHHRNRTLKKRQFKRSVSSDIAVVIEQWRSR